MLNCQILRAIIRCQHPVRCVQGPSHDKDVEETNTYIKIVEDGEEGETSGPMPAATKGQPDLTLVTYRIGRSCITEAEFDKYVTQGLIKPTLRGLCQVLG